MFTPLFCGCQSWTSLSTSKVRFLFDHHSRYFIDSSQDGNGGATEDVSNQEAVYSQIKKFQVGTIRIYNIILWEFTIILVSYMSD